MGRRDSGADSFSSARILLLKRNPTPQVYGELTLHAPPRLRARPVRRIKRARFFFLGGGNRPNNRAGAFPL
jgi:hypothetical protein